MRFTKMHGAGNDYVYVDGFQEQVTDPAALARVVSNRHTGIGSDGLILILPSGAADARMRMFNPDGTESEMCGNGIRCVAKYVHDHGIARKPALRIETGAGVLTLEVSTGPDGLVERVRVDMGEPRLEPQEIPVDPGAEQVDTGGPVVRATVDVEGHSYELVCVGMGNPHAVVFVDDVAAVDLARLGPVIEHHAMFPRRTNVHFVQVHPDETSARANVHVVQVRGPREVTMRTWERGTGATQACGTGACAVCVAGHLTGRTERTILAHLPGGDLELEWAADNHVFMTGPAVEVFSGEWPDR